MKNRKSESIAPLIESYSAKSKTLPRILFSPSDIGVRRNGGKNGTRFGPQAIMFSLNKLNNHYLNDVVITHTVSNQETERLDFVKAQIQSSNEIEKHLRFETKPIIHIGGGHDHAYPLLRAAHQREEIKKIVCVNIDAHCDTRVDTENHSGTPFRNFDQFSSKPFHIIQVGIQDFANSKSTLGQLENSTEQKFSIDQIRVLSKNFNEIPATLFQEIPFEICQDTLVFFSLDCDAIDGGFMSGVSAINPDGIPPHYIKQLLKHCFQTFSAQKNIFGIYEYNPIHDPHSLGSKYLAQLIYSVL